MITIDLTMFIQIANVLILIVIMNAVLYRPVRTIIQERREKIEALQKDVETFNRNAELRVEEFDQKIRETRIAGKSELDAARGEAKTAGAETLATVRGEVDADKAGQIATIETELATAQQQLRGQVDEFANEMAEKILGRSL